MHKLLDIIVIAITAVIAGADSWNDFEEYGEAKEEWPRSFLVLPGGIPSHDTFARIFARLDPAIFNACFVRWLTAASEAVKGLIPIDGKTLRGSGKVLRPRLCISCRRGRSKTVSFWVRSASPTSPTRSTRSLSS